MIVSAGEGNSLFQIGGKVYEVMINHKNGWNAEAFRSRYSEILERYDYIVGDWGYNQLRLKGMYKDGQPKAAKESQFSFTTDYITEHCNFGCAYFVLHKVKDLKDVKDPEEAAMYPDLGEIKEPAREYRQSSKTQEAAKEKGEQPNVKERKESRGGRGDRDAKQARGERSQETSERDPKEKTQSHPGKKHAQRERPNRENQSRERDKDKDKAKSSGGEHQRNRKREDRGGESRPAQRRENGERREQAAPPQSAQSNPNTGERPDQETAK